MKRVDCYLSFCVCGNLIGLVDLRLDVSVEYPVAVHVLDRLQQLVDVKLHARLR